MAYLFSQKQTTCLTFFNIYEDLGSKELLIDQLPAFILGAKDGGGGGPARPAMSESDIFPFHNKLFIKIKKERKKYLMKSYAMFLRHHGSIIDSKKLNAL